MSGPQPGRGDRRRLFFALWPDPALRRALAVATGGLVAAVTGRPEPAANLHVTLAYLGMAPGETVARLLEIGHRGRWPRIELDFDHAEYWAKPRVLVAIPAAAPAAGLRTVERLWESAERLGFRRESRPWLPHLTLVRKVSRPPPRGEALPIPRRPARDAGAWKLALVESVAGPSGSRYKPLARWAFKGDASNYPSGNWTRPL